MTSAGLGSFDQRRAAKTYLYTSGHLKGKPPDPLLGSVVCFAAYARDKSAAKTRRWRTSEGTLLMLGFLGGWPGAILAQQLFRHKTTKASFQSKFWASVILNVAGFIAFASPLLASIVGKN